MKLRGFEKVVGSYPGPNFEVFSPILWLTNPNKITNNYDLPQSFVNFVRNDKYSKGDANISVTSIIDSPRIRLMRDTHRDEMTTDVSDMIWPLFGTAVQYLNYQGPALSYVYCGRASKHVEGVFKNDAKVLGCAPPLVKPHYPCCQCPERFPPVGIRPRGLALCPLAFPLPSPLALGCAPLCLRSSLVSRGLFGVSRSV